MDFYEKVINKCKEKGVSRSKMADDIGMSRSTPKEWQTGNVTPRFETIKKMADYFDVPIEYFSDDYSTESELSKQEQMLIDIFRKLNIMNQARLLIYAEKLQDT